MHVGIAADHGGSTRANMMNGVSPKDPGVEVPGDYCFF